MEGHLKIVVFRPVEPDNMPQQTVAPETYAEYPLIISSQEEKKEIARLTADKSGNYRVALPPGAYILHAQERTEERAERIHANPQPFTVVSNQTVRVDMTIFIEPVKGQASASSRVGCYRIFGMLAGSTSLNAAAPVQLARSPQVAKCNVKRACCPNRLLVMSSAASRDCGITIIIERFLDFARNDEAG
jgi:hypothetical protein